MSTILALVIAAAALVVGIGCGYLLFLRVIKGKYNEMIDSATKEAEVIKEKKLLEVKDRKSVV